MTTIRVAPGEPLVTEVAMAEDCDSGAARIVATPRQGERHTETFAAAACDRVVDRAGTTKIGNVIAQQMGV